MLHPSQMLFVGMDVHKDNHAAVAADCFGQVYLEKEMANTYQDFQKLVHSIRAIAQVKRLKPVFGLEDSYGNGHQLARFLFSKGLEIRVINPVLVSRERDRMTHPEKSDLQDAKGVVNVLASKIGRLPYYRITEASEINKDLRALVSDRDFLVREQTRLKNQLHSLLHRSYGSCYKDLSNGPFTKKALKFWNEFPSLAALKSTKKRTEKPAWLKQLSREAMPQISEIQQRQIQRKAKRLLEIKLELKELEADLQEVYTDTKQHLETLPGCGLAIASRILAEVKDIDRFSSSAKFAKYAGLAPRANESGKRKRKFRYTRGNRRLNYTFYRIALTQISTTRGTDQARTYYQKKLAENKSKRQAIRCLKRQISDIVYSMLKEQRPYYELLSPRSLGHHN